MDFIAIPLSYLITFLYDSIGFHNYGLTIIFFTLVIKIIMLPLTIKQTKSTAKQQELQPEIAKLQKRYKNDKEKLNQEMMKFYKENNFNPASGCLPLIVQMPILLSLYWVVIEPIKFLLQYHKLYSGNEMRMVLRKITGNSITDYRADIDTLSSLSKNEAQFFNDQGQVLYNKSVFLNDNGDFILNNLGAYTPDEAKSVTVNSISALVAGNKRTALFTPNFTEIDLTQNGALESVNTFIAQKGWNDLVKPEEIFKLDAKALGGAVYDFPNNELYIPIMDNKLEIGRNSLYKASDYMKENQILAKDILTQKHILINSDGDIVNQTGDIMFNAQGQIDNLKEVYLLEGAKQVNKSILVDGTGGVINGDGLVSVTDGHLLMEKAQLVNLNFLGLDLGRVASYKFWEWTNPGDMAIYLPLLALVVLTTAITFFSSKMAMPKTDPHKKKEAPVAGPAGANMGKSMMYFGPLMTLFIAFVMPAGAVLYWAVSSLFQWGQQLYINKFVKGKDKGAKA